MDGSAGEAVDVRAALLRMRRSAMLPVTFGGLVSQPGAAFFRITELSGADTESLRGLQVRTGNGLGGKTLALRRPYAVTDYGSSRTISHEYDAAVAGEGLRSVLAVPIVVHRQVRGVLYGALREACMIGDRPLAAAMDAARDLEQAIVARDEARRLLASCQPPVVTANPRAWEEVRDAHRELRGLAVRIGDPQLRRELLAACARLASAAVPGVPAQRAPVVQLTARELDVLAAIASGATNAGAAARLRLQPETVKSYLRSAMRKLGAHTRLEAVTSARRSGLLP